jgi:hypothetical protein
MHVIRCLVVHSNKGADCAIWMTGAHGIRDAVLKYANFARDCYKSLCAFVCTSAHGAAALGLQRGHGVKISARRGKFPAPGCNSTSEKQVGADQAPGEALR